MSIDPKAMLEAIEALDQPEMPGDEWKTAREWQALWGIGRDKTHRHLRRAVEAGKMEAQRLPCKRPDGVVQTYPHYRWVGDAKR